MKYNSDIIVRGKGWVSDMPFKSRYLVIAAYLASKNSKDSDKYTFGDAKRGRRKRPREGNLDAIGENSQGANASILTHAPLSFTMDRLLAIFRHIYSHHHDTGEPSVSTNQRVVTTVDGDERLLSMVNNFVFH